MKTCPRCHKVYPATNEYFYRDSMYKGGLKARCKVCWKEYYKEHAEEKREYGKRYYKRRTEYKIKYYRNRRKTVVGYLRCVYDSINKRCENLKDRSYKHYGGRGIRMGFTSFDDFRDYVINVLKVDPRGRQIHRIDNDGHYEKGNIEFLTGAKHKLKHKHRKRGAK